MPVTVTDERFVELYWPVTVNGIPTYNVEALQVNVPSGPAMATDESVVVLYVPATVTGCPTANPVVLVQENVPLAPVTATLDNV